MTTGGAALKAIADIHDWASRIAALPVDGPLPSRTVLVPNEATAHALRRALVLGGHQRALPGTKFLTHIQAAAEVLADANVLFEPGEDSIRASRLLSLFRTQKLPLQYFTPALLASRPGWDAAFASTISELEGAGLTHAKLAELAAAQNAQAQARLADVAAVWSAVSSEARNSWTIARQLSEAAAVLGADTARWPYDGPTLVTVTGHESAVHAAFVQAIPRVTLAVHLARPRRTPHAHRIEHLYGPALRTAYDAPESHAPPESELALLRAYLFESPDMLAAPGRPTIVSMGGVPDGTVDLEEHAGVEAELEATALWLTREVLVHRTPLEEMAVLVPSLDPLAGMLVDRIASLPWAQEAANSPVHVRGGLPASATSTGARLLTLLRALRGHLHLGLLADALPSLRLDSDARTHVTRGAALELVSGLGTVGGTPANPLGALDWLSRVAAREAHLVTTLAQPSKDDDDQRELERHTRELETLRGVLPALTALSAVARAYVRGTPLRDLWPLLDALIEQHLLVPGEGKAIVAQLRGALSSACAKAACASLTGDDALALIEDTMHGLRTTLGRFGQPAITIATVHSAAGLPFSAVRVLGLAEGKLPSVPREDPVLPDATRALLTGYAVPRLAERSLAQLHALSRVVICVTQRIALSVPRMDLERSYRDRSAVLLEAETALGRAGFRAARESLERFARESPLTESTWQERAATKDANIPARWMTRASLDLARTRALLSMNRAADAMDGIFPKSGPFPTIPGLSAERPISASRLKTLLACPHLFLFQSVLGWWEARSTPEEGAIDAASYGTLFHSLAERFYEEHGAAFCRKERTLDAWKKLAVSFVDAAFAEFLLGYPLPGKGVQGAHRSRIERDFMSLLELDWAEDLTFVAVERAFGVAEPFSLPAGKERLHLRGYIDRLDTRGKTTVVRDLKTGRAKPREPGDFRVGRDVQIAVYGLVAREQAEAWGTPSGIHASYVHPSDENQKACVFPDGPELLQHGEEWLGLSAGLLTARAFPRTPIDEDCTYCAFKAVCGPHARERATAVLAGAKGAVAELRTLKMGGHDE
jgi:RecB family exonuclease